jgi:uncharacterized protein YfiM (DUF2279 family)
VCVNRTGAKQIKARSCACCCKSLLLQEPVAARLAGVDAWFGADKAGHFAACAAVTAAAWVLQERAVAKAGGAARGCPRSRATRLALAVAAGLVVGIAKEALDAAGVRLRLLLTLLCCA